MRAHARKPRIPSVLALCAVVMLAALAGAPGASAAGPSLPWLKLSTAATPTNLAPGGEGTIVVSASNLGSSILEADKETLTITDKLPEGLEITGAKPVSCAGGPEEPVCVIRYPTSGTHPMVKPFPKCPHTASEVKCPMEEPLAPFETWNIYLTVKVSPSVASGTKLTNTVTAQGGKVAPRTLTRPVTVSSETVPFGVEDYELSAEDEQGNTDLHAGSQPFQLTTKLNFNTIYQKFPSGLIEPSVPATARNLHVNLPAGLSGNANKQVIPQCTELQFTTPRTASVNECPENTAIGAVIARVTEPVSLKSATISAPVYNLVPAPGEPARFGFLAGPVPVTIDTAVHEGDYHVVASVNSASAEPALISSLITIWGVPGDPRHDQSRGTQCLAREANLQTGEVCELLNSSSPLPFLTLPTSCEVAPGQPLPMQTSVVAQSWLFGATPLAPVSPDSATSLQGCNALPFNPTMTISPTQHESNTPTGLRVNLHVPQPSTLAPGTLAEANVRDTTVALPEGVQLSPSAANGLEACSETQIGWLGRPGLTTPGRNPLTHTLEFEFNQDELDLSEEAQNEKGIGCPKASKVGTVEIKTPILEKPLHGSVYLAKQNENPFGTPEEPGGSRFGIYIVVKDKSLGVLVKLAGKVELDKLTGRVTSTFPDAPQLPFEDLTLELFSGPRASLATPRACGGYTSQTAFTPWSEALNEHNALESSLNPGEFAITSGPHGTGCANPQPFSPGFAAGTTNPQAGAFTPFTLTLTRADTDQALRSLSVTLPPGVAGYLTHVKQCPNDQAEAGTCGPESLIGSAKAVSGLGEDPFTVEGGRVYITEKYAGAPFGLAIVLPAKAGPFDFGHVVTRSTINVDPNTAQLTVSSAIPTMIETVEQGRIGVPVQVRRVDVTIDRPEFQFNPTNCSALSVTGTVGGDQGASVAVSSPFQVKGCQSLAFEPELTAVTQSHFSKVNGTSLKVVVKAKPGQANIAKTKIAFPLQLPSRLTTIQKACPDSVFNANPASCPEGSVIGSAIAHTPVLNSPLAGPAYLVSHGGAAFPDAEFVLQGEGVTLVLDGQTDIKKGITTSTFNSVPDAPVSTFEVTLPEGPHSAFTGFGDLCNKTVKKTVTVRKKIGKSKRFRKVKRTVSSKQPTTLFMPTILTGQNGNVIEKNTKLGVAGCKAVKPFEKAKAKPKKKKKKKKRKRKK